MARNVAAPSEAAQVMLPGTAPTVSVCGARVDFLAGAAATGGAWACLTYTAPPHFSGPPLHWHEKTLEGFFVLAGTLSLILDKRTVHAPPGAFILIPPRVIHTYFNDQPEPVTYLLLISPAGFERFFAEEAELLRNDPTWPPANLAPLKALIANYDYHLVEDSTPGLPTPN